MKKHTIFMIEDEHLLCELFTEYVSLIPQVEFLGYSRDGQEAMRKCLQIKPDVIVLDIRLPEVNGLEILTLLRRKLPDSKIVLFTGTIREDTLKLAVELGASAFVEKGYGLDELKQAIESVLAGKPHFSPGVAQLVKTFRV